MKLFKRFYLKFIQWFATFLLNRTNTVLRHLIVLKGKDPDFVPPPPAPPAPAPEPARTTQKTLRPMFSFGSSGEYVTEPAKHPVIRSRREFEDKQAKQKAAAAAAVPAPLQVTTTTEIGGESINALREAFSNVEQAVMAAPNGTAQNKD